MKLQVMICILLISLVPAFSKASIFGEETIVLTQILAETIQELIQIKALLSSNQDSLGIMQEMSRGINDSLALYKSLSPNSQAGIYSDWKNAQSVIQNLQSIYGLVSLSPEAKVQHDTDQQVAEAVTLNNSIYEYTNQIDQIGEDIKNASNDASPGRAEKLTAQSLGVMLHVLDQQLRTQATSLKLQAQGLAIQNKKDKDATRFMIDSSKQLSNSMKFEKTSFEIPRFSI
jgi:hypothetical protein